MPLDLDASQATRSGQPPPSEHGAPIRAFQLLYDVVPVSSLKITRTQRGEPGAICQPELRPVFIGLRLRSTKIASDSRSPPIRRFSARNGNPHVKWLRHSSMVLAIAA